MADDRYREDDPYSDDYDQADRYEDDPRRTYPGDYQGDHKRRRTAARYPDDDASSGRGRRTAITLLIVLVLLGGAFYYAYSYWQRPAQTATGPTCPTATTGTAMPVPGEVTVNVYNATKRSGLAGSVSKLVSQRGFKIGSVANDPAKKTITGTAEVRYGPAGEKGASLVAKLVTGAVPVKDAKREGASVDLVLGDGYTDLAPAPTGSTASPASSGTTSGC